MPAFVLTKYTVAEWIAEGTRIFGADMLQWRFVCPSCGHIQTAEEFRPYGAAAGATANSVTCECIGRYTGAKDAFVKGQQPCNYAGYGLFHLSPVRVIQEDGHETHAFAFADSQPEAR